MVPSYVANNAHNLYGALSPHHDSRLANASFGTYLRYDWVDKMRLIFGQPDSIVINRDSKTSWDNTGAWRCNVCLSCQGKESVLLDNFSNEGKPLVYNPTGGCAPVVLCCISCEAAISLRRNIAQRIDGGQCRAVILFCEYKKGS